MTGNTNIKREQKSSAKPSKDSPQANDKGQRSELDQIDSQMTLNALPHPVLIIGGENEILFANFSAESFFQASVQMLKRLKVDELVSFGNPLLSLIEQVRRNWASVNEYGVDIGTPKIGDDKLVDIFVGPISENSDQLLLLLQQRNMAQMIERQFTHQGAVRSVSAMAAVLAHEIKNPLSGIRGAAQLMETSLSEDDKVFSRLIYTEIDRICTLVDKMEVFGDERPVPLEPVNIHAVLNHVKTVAQTGFAKNIQLIENYDPSLPPVPGDRDKLIQAFLNLVKNAAEAIDEDQTERQIVISTAFRPGVRLTLPGSKTKVSLPLEISIEDNGGGVPEDLLPHLFDPFVTTKTNGTGLGLALVAKIIRDHGGIIECNSHSRRTIFRALMPLQHQNKNTVTDMETHNG